MKRTEDDRASRIEGTITLPDGTESKFSIDAGYGWQQWGAYPDRLSRSVHILDAITGGLTEADSIVEDDMQYEEDEDD